MHALREQASPERTRSLFAGDTVSPMMCLADGQQKNDKKRPHEHSEDEGRGKAEKNKNRPQRGGGFSLNLDLCAWCFEVIWCV